MGVDNSMTKGELMKHNATHERTPEPPPAEGVRLRWPEIPARLRAAVEGWLGSSVVGEVPSPGPSHIQARDMLTTDTPSETIHAAIDCRSPAESALAMYMPASGVMSKTVSDTLVP